MKKIISNKHLELSKDEFIYYKDTLEKALGPNPLVGMFKTDNDGIITSINLDANQPRPMISIFFLLNVRFNQALRRFADKVEIIEGLEDRILALEKRLDE